MSDHETFLEALARNRAAVERFVGRAQAVAPQTWNVPRAAGKWSPAQEAVHLALTYQAYVAELRAGPSVTPETFPARNPELRTSVLPRIVAGDWFPSGVVAPSPARPGEGPRDQREVVDQLVERARAFEEAVVEARTRDPARCVRHPYLGALQLAELLAVIAEHAKHHSRNLPDAR
jgi:uncharacterized damage-inducible protein DinB